MECDLVVHHESAAGGADTRLSCRWCHQREQPADLEVDLFRSRGGIALVRPQSGNDNAAPVAFHRDQLRRRNDTGCCKGAVDVLLADRGARCAGAHHFRSDLELYHAGQYASHRAVIYISLIHISEPTRQAEISYAV